MTMQNGATDRQASNNENHKLNWLLLHWLSLLCSSSLWWTEPICELSLFDILFSPLPCDLFCGFSSFFLSIKEQQGVEK